MLKILKTMLKKLGKFILNIIKNLLKRIVGLILFWSVSILLFIFIICYIFNYDFIDTILFLFNYIFNLIYFWEFNYFNWYFLNSNLL